MTIALCKISCSACRKTSACSRLNFAPSRAG